MLLLGHTFYGDALVAFGVISPARTGGQPSALHPCDGTVDVEHFEQKFEGGATQVDAGLERCGRQGRTRLGERIEYGGRPFTAGHRRRCEVLPDRFVFGAWEQQHVGVVGGPPRAPDLLVVGDRARRGAEVHHESEIRLVEPHSQRGCRHESLEFVGLQHALRLFAFGRIGLPRVGAHGVTGAPQ